MGFWRKSKSRIERERYAETIRDLNASQSNSLLQEFMDYVNGDVDTHRLVMSTAVSRTGEFTVTAGFKGEEPYKFVVEAPLIQEILEDPALLIDFMETDDSYEDVNDALHETEGVLEHLNTLYEKAVKGSESHEALCISMGSRITKRMLEEMEQWILTLVELKELREKKRMDLKLIWLNSPYFIERFSAAYDAFLRQRVIPITDPVEVDLMKLLENEKLSDETKAKAGEYLASYRVLQLEKEGEEEVEAAEQEASLILSTVERHYLKGGSCK